MNAMRHRILVDEPTVNQRLDELGLCKKGLLEVRDRALAASANANPNFPKNARGTFSYLFGVEGLRVVIVGEHWYKETVNNMEFVRNDHLSLRVGLSNVDIAGHQSKSPKARSNRGEVSKRVCLAIGDLFPETMDSNVNVSIDQPATYFLMIDSKGGAELSRPVIHGNNYSDFVERICLSDGSDITDMDIKAPDSAESRETENSFDPVVARR